MVRRAVAAYHEMKKEHKGAFTGTTANEVLEELKPSPVRSTDGCEDGGETPTV